MSDLIQIDHLRKRFGDVQAVDDLSFPDAVIESVRDSVDWNLYFMGTSVSMGGMYAVLLITIVVFIALYISLNLISAKKHR